MHCLFQPSRALWKLEFPAQVFAEKQQQMTSTKLGIQQITWLAFGGDFVQASAAQEADGDYTDFCKTVLNVTLTGNYKTPFDFPSIFKQNTFWHKIVYILKSSQKTSPGHRHVNFGLFTLLQ